MYQVDSSGISIDSYKSCSFSLIFLGATGPSGRLVMEQALQRGHTVKALVRTPSKITMSHQNLQVSLQFFCSCRPREAYSITVHVLL